MPSIDATDLDFLQAVALVVVALALRAVLEHVSSLSKRKRISSDIEIAERLSSFELTDSERTLVDSFRKGIVRDLPVRRLDKRPEFKPFDFCLCAWIVSALYILATGGNWTSVVVFMVLLGGLGLFGNACYEMGASNGRLRQREDLIAEKRVENEHYRAVHERKEDDTPENHCV